MRRLNGVPILLVLNRNTKHKTNMCTHVHVILSVYYKKVRLGEGLNYIGMLASCVSHHCKDGKGEFSKLNSNCNHAGTDLKIYIHSSFEYSILNGIYSYTNVIDGAFCDN